MLAGLACVYLHEDERWVPLDPRPAENECTDLGEYRLSVEPDPELEEENFEVVFSRPHRGVVDVLSRAPDLDHVRRFLPDSL